MSSNDFFDFRVSPYRFVPLTLVRSSGVNARLDEVTDGFDEVKAQLALKAWVNNAVFTGGITFNGAGNIDLTSATSVTVPVPTALIDNSAKPATTSWVQYLIGSLSVGLPTQAGNTDEALFTDGTSAEWRELARVVRRPILQDNAPLLPASTGEDICLRGYPGLGTLSGYIAYGSGLYVVGPGVASVNVASSPDGLTWTTRTMPSSEVWRFGSDGTNFLAVVAASTSTAVSSNGAAWSSATALPSSLFNLHQPIKVGGLWIVAGNASTTYYTSADGVAWAARTLPAFPSALCLVGTTAWIRTDTTTAYTSTDGINWTVRAINDYNQVTVDSDGALYGYVAGSLDLFKTTDGIAWADSGLDRVAGGYFPVTINGVRFASAVVSAVAPIAMTATLNDWTPRGNLANVIVLGGTQTSIHSTYGQGVLGGRGVSTSQPGGVSGSFGVTNMAAEGLFA